MVKNNGFLCWYSCISQFNVLFFFFFPLFPFCIMWEEDPWVAHEGKPFNWQIWEIFHPEAAARKRGGAAVVKTVIELFGSYQAEFRWPAGIKNNKKKNKIKTKYQQRCENKKPLQFLSPSLSALWSSPTCWRSICSPANRILRPDFLFAWPRAPRFSEAAAKTIPIWF